MMKTLLIILFLTSSAFAANTVPMSEAQRYIAACPGSVPGQFSCKDKPNEPCLDFSQIEDWCVAEIVNGKLVNNQEKLAALRLRQIEETMKSERKRNLVNTLKAIDTESGTSIASLRALMKQLKEAMIILAE